ncbi:MAG: hypothetical protein M1817_001828 [Caeruleum heppii]|nr:MAG: hypothetical protein M1817_001828 [Caeruleum heppii]
MFNAGKKAKSPKPLAPLNITPPPIPTTSNEGKKSVTVTSRPRTSSSSSSLKTPRTPRFAEATAVHSPIEPSQAGRSPFADPPAIMENHYQPQAQPSDVGFGYLAENDASRHASYVGVAIDDAPKSPLKSALKVPGTPGRLNPMSPTFKEEQVLEKHEEATEKENAKDLKVKIRVRMAKVVLRGVGFSCSLIVLAMVGATLAIFNATRHLAPRNNLPPWAASTSVWPQITLLVIASISLIMSIVILWMYFRGGHKRAEKAAVYYTVFAVVFFAFTIIMWAVGAGILNGTKQNGNGQDMWGWSCKDNKRKKLFENDVNFDLVCRLQNWSLVCCIIEIVLEIMIVLIYGIVFYRFWSKRKLRKSMDVRDKARSDLYLAQLRTQSAPNTPGLGGPMSPRFPPSSEDEHSKAEEGGYYGTQFASQQQSVAAPKPFQLQPPPIKIHHATPRAPQDGFEAAPAPTPTHVPAAAGERTYAAVPIPGAYASPVASPSFAPTMQYGAASPPSSPRLAPGVAR